MDAAMAAISSCSTFGTASQWCFEKDSRAMTAAPLVEACLSEDRAACRTARSKSASSRRTLQWNLEPSFAACKK